MWEHKSEPTLSMTAVEGGRSWRGAASWEWREGQERLSKWLEWGGSDTTLCAVRGPLSWSCCPLSQAKEKGRKASKWALEQLSRGRTGLWALCCWAQRTFSYHWTLISFIPTSSRRKSLTQALITEKVGLHLGLFRRDFAVRSWSWIQSTTELLPSEEQSPSRDGGVSCKTKYLLFQKYSIVVLRLQFAGEGTDFCCLILGLGFSFWL